MMELPSMELAFERKGKVQVSVCWWWGGRTHIYIYGLGECLQMRGDEE